MSSSLNKKSDNNYSIFNYSVDRALGPIEIESGAINELRVKVVVAGTV